mgnify:FL=1
MRILVLHGGNSPERDISIRSAQSVISELEQLDLECVTYDLINGLEGLVKTARICDVVLPILHEINR